jgi:hypothetical protein
VNCDNRSTIFEKPDVMVFYIDSRWAARVDSRCLLVKLSHAEECRFVPSHGGNKQISIEKKIAHFATRFSDQKATVTCGAMRRTVAAAIVGFVISANRIV